MRSQEKRLLNVRITREDGFVTVGRILPEEEQYHKDQGSKVEKIDEKELKSSLRTKQFKKVISNKSK